MAIDLKTSDGRMNFLNDKLADLVSGVDSAYGNIIFDELIKRIEATISDFNEEMEHVFSDLQENEKERRVALNKMKRKKIKKESGNLTDWEQKLLSMYSEKDKEEQEG